MLSRSSEERRRCVGIRFRPSRGGFSGSASSFAFALALALALALTFALALALAPALALALASSTTDSETSSITTGFSSVGESAVKSKHGGGNA